jgi:hypothetical protein
MNISQQRCSDISASKGELQAGAASMRDLQGDPLIV